MKAIITGLLFVLVLQGCDQVQTPIVENNLSTAKSEGRLIEQLELVDELVALDALKHQALADEKERLLPYLQQIIDDPKNLDNIDVSTLAEIVEFSPNYPPLSYAKQRLSKLKELDSRISSLAEEKTALKKQITDKLQSTPNHVTTYDTQIKLSQLPPYFIAADYFKQLLFVDKHKPLSGYHIEVLGQSLSMLYTTNRKLIDAVDALSMLSSDTDTLLKAQSERENQDVVQLLLWIYKKQLIVSYHFFKKKNTELLSLLNNHYGRKNIDDIWLNTVEPVAKKVVIEGKEGHLNAMNILSAKLSKMSNEHPRFSNLYAENDDIEQLMLTLVWPSNGLANFETGSTMNSKMLAQIVSSFQQR